MIIKVYMIVTNDAYELPVCCGLVGAKAAAEYLGVSELTVRKSISRGKWNEKYKYKAVPDVDGTAAELERRRKVTEKKVFMADRTEYKQKWHERKRQQRAGNEESKQRLK